MASYMNPSKKVTEVLSRYLEFDPEQLQLGIWSGNLSLTDVNLREEAIYPILNSHLTKRSSSSAAGPGAPSQPQQDYAKPPLRFKLVSGKIGSLSMKIPWKRLVWTQGDVQVDIRNVTIVLALESREETEERKNEGQESVPDYSYDSEEETVTDLENESKKHGTSHGERRRRKQLILREAERRNLAGRSLGPWLLAIKKKEEEDRVKSGTAAADVTATLREKESSLLRWLRSTTTDFLWRFCVGLQMNVENVKILLVQDGIELGLVMPSNKVIPGNPGKRRSSAPGVIVREAEEQGNRGESESAVTPPQNMVYEGEYDDDGEYVDKQIQSVGISVYIRKVSHHHYIVNDDFKRVPVDVYSSDNILRPVNVDYNFSLFFPAPPEKRKGKSTQKTTIHEHRNESVADESSTGASESASSTKLRRGKREKQATWSTDTTAVATEPTTITRPNGPDSAVSLHKRSRTVSAAFPNSLTPLKAQRMSSVGSRFIPSRPDSWKARCIGGHERYESSSSALPLAHPDDIVAFYAAATKEGAGKTAQCKGNLSFGAVHIVCSTGHYNLINAFLAAGSKMRNGRPRMTIRSVLDHGEHSITDDPDNSSIPIDQLGASARTDEHAGKARVVRLWWRYVFGVLFWELNQRKRLRKIFQQKFLSFSWKRQHYKRLEYVRLYISVRLRNPDALGHTDDLAPSRSSKEEELLVIEEKLPVEQILLYRSLARAVHVRGGTEMPTSILELRKKSEVPDKTPAQGSRSPPPPIQSNASGAAGAAPAHGLDQLENDKHDGFIVEEYSNFLSLLEARCEIARQRRIADHDDLPSFQPIEKRSNAVDRGGFDEISFGLASESRTIKTSKTHASGPSVAASARETMSSQESASVGMLFEFAVNVEKLELTVVEEGSAPIGFPSSSGSGRSSSGSATLSEVSVLTDDARFFREPDDNMTSQIEDSEPSGPIFASSDFLLFRAPETILLQLVITPLSFSTLGRIGGSRNLNFSIGQVVATGDNGAQLLEIGSSPLEGAPVREVDVSRQNHRHSVSHHNMPKEALSLSFVDKNNYNFLQCDAALVRGEFDPLTVSRVVAFASQSSALFPKQLLKRTSREEVRLYVLQQNETPFAAWNCSIRLHGCELSLPLKAVQAQEGGEVGGGDFSLGSGSVVPSGAVVLLCDIVEIYSGSAVEELSAAMEGSQVGADVPGSVEKSAAQPNAQTRQLSMLDVPELMHVNRSLLSSHWVLATSGVDIGLNAQHLLEEPLDIEVFYTGNADSLLDFNRAKREIVFEVSPVHFLVSDERIRQVSRIDLDAYLSVFASTPTVGPNAREQPTLPPRLEVLSTFMRYSIDFSISRVRISFLAHESEKAVMSPLSKQLAMEEYMSDFLRVVSRFDLSFPHEEALSASMQICIDRLAGVGLPLEESWEATNLALLNFLEDMAEAGRISSEGSSSASTAPSGSPDKDRQIVQRTVDKSVERTVALYIDRLEQEVPEVCIVDDDVVIDLPDGVALTYVSFFYDYHVSMGIPSLFLANGLGIHVLRITPPDRSETGEHSRNANGTNASERSLEVGVDQHPSSFGMTLQRFALDSDHRFGKGGLPLAILGTDGDVSDSERRTREHMDDLEIGDIELLFSHRVVHEMVASLLRICSHFGHLRDNSHSIADGRDPVASINSSFVQTAASASALFVSDALFPFTRLVLGNILARSASFVASQGKGEDDESRRPSSHCSVRTLGLLNLTPEGELFPQTISVLPGHIGPCLSARFNPREDLNLDLEMCGLRVVLLRQYLNECLQYFISGNYGLGSLMAFLKEQSPPKPHESSEPFLYQVTFHAFSLVLPRSSSSYDMLCVECEKATIVSSRPTSSFRMPTDSMSFAVESEDSDALGDGDGLSLNLGIGEEQSISRHRITLAGFRIFSSLPEQEPVDFVHAFDSPSFRFFFAMDGRAKAGKVVYRPIVGPENVVEGDDLQSNDERAARIWREITVDQSSLGILVDYAPHLRILISDPLDGTPAGGLELDMRISQFCLLLSVWFSNMQELPLMFPFSALQLQVGSRSLYHGVTFPDHGTEAFTALLKETAGFTSEVAIVLKTLSLRCTFDREYSKVERSEAGVPGVTVGFDDAVVHVTNDYRGVTRIGSGSSRGFLVDESLIFSDVLGVGGTSKQIRSWADLHFGIERSHRSLGESLPQAFQLSIFMTPSWTVYNLGLEAPHIVLSDLSPVYKFLEYVSSYFSEAKFGSPSFEAMELAARVKRELSGISEGGRTPPAGSGIDFRLWLGDPTLAVPCDPGDRGCPGIRITGGGSGVWYKYTSVDFLTTQECVSDSLHLIFDDICARRSVRDDDEEAGRTLIERLSLGLRYDSNSASNHTDVALQIPFVDMSACGLGSHRISVSPTVLSSPTVCVPFERPGRTLGAVVCEITCIIELLPSTSSALMNLFGVSDPKLDEKCLTSEDSEDDLSRTEGSTDTESNGTISLVARVGDFRIFALDPVLGPHLPVAVASVSLVSVTVSRFATLEKKIDGEDRGAPPEDLQVAISGHLWADYFKLGMTRSWEPLVEAYRFSALIEKSRFRGSGLSINSDTDLHLNITSALLVILDEVVDVFNRLIRSTFASDLSSRGDTEEEQEPASDRLVIADSLGGHEIHHEVPKPMERGDRVAFSLRNMTGQKLRIFRSSGALTYLHHDQTTKLSFLPSISMIKNLSVKEVAYPGLPTGSRQYRANVPPHTVDVQPTGFRWLEGIAVDTFGRSFAKLVPQSPETETKVASDWRLANAMNLLVEVGLENGGRQVTFRSVFSVANKTNHDIVLLFNPDPAYKPLALDLRTSLDEDSNDGKPRATGVGEDTRIEPGSTFQIPSLLIENSLRQPGTHLGSMWLKPAEGVCDFQSFLAESPGTTSNLTVDFSSRAVHLAKLVGESSSLFEAARGHALAPEDAKSGVQVSCPVVQNTGDRLPPFCYALEVGRSPIVEARGGSDVGPMATQGAMHGPVAYTLSIHPPLVIANLLPEKGRFELMHAVHRTVLWFGDLEPGQEMAVHSVGLDAPLVLLINLGFAKTPVGEGALVHHGTDPPPGARENLGLKSIGRAGKAVTKQLGKTLTSMSDTPDKRGLKKMVSAQNPQFVSKTMERDRKVRIQAKSDLDLDTAVSGIDKVDGKTYKIDTFHFFPHDVVDEMNIVDGLGQRLTLNIDNIRGGGGHRRLSVFCRFWILNTTEHCLRYKQENSKLFVSGTVISPDKNGSLPLSGGRSRAKYETPELSNSNPLNDETIFSGTPGALATYPGRCNLPPDQVAPLIDKHIPLEKIARLAFMFNFHDGTIMTIGNQKLCVQLGDGTGTTSYESDWSRGFSLDTVGISQPLGLHCKDGRALEISAVVTVAPGFLAKYTKIVRFLPRYVVVNTLPYPVRIWQDNSIFRPLSADNTGAQESSAKWRYHKEGGRKNESKVNQYEALWGRTTVLEGGLSAGTAAHGSALYIATVMPSQIVPFSLPDSRGERQLRVDRGQPWSLSPSFNADEHSDHIMKLRRAVDLRTIPHVSTRSNPRYEVRLPPNGDSSFHGELGIWFETEWGASRSLIVKAVKKNSYAFNETDVHVGDELLAIDGVPVSRMTFQEAMNMLRSRLHDLPTANRNDLLPNLERRSILRSTPRIGSATAASSGGEDSEVSPAVLSFRTVEERLRRVRLKAAKASSSERMASEPISQPNSRHDLSLPTRLNADGDVYIEAELKTLSQSDLGMFLLLRDDPVVPYQIQNRSVHSTIYYRQRGCSHHSWQSLRPGQERSYSWEEPLKPMKLTVRVASDSTFQNADDESISNLLQDSVRNGAEIHGQRRRPFRKVEGEEDSVFSPSQTVLLEEIGFHKNLPIFSPGSSKNEKASARSLELEVNVEGAIRILTVRDVSTEENDKQMERHLESLEKMAQCEEERLRQLKMLNVFVGPAETIDPVSNEAENCTASEGAQAIMEDFSDATMITHCHQIAVEVLEAVGLSTESFFGSCNPYAEIWLKSNSSGRKLLFRRKDLRRTYFVRKSVNPTWNSQTFIFDVPREAVSVTRGHSLEVCLRNFRALGHHQTLGRAQVDLHSVRNQEPLLGWFPLAGRTGRRELENQLSHWGRGSVKLRVQWIYSTPALIQYFILLSENRLQDLQASLGGMSEQLQKEKEAQKKSVTESDGFKAVRGKDLLARSRIIMKTRNAQIQKLKKLNKSVAKKLAEPLRHYNDTILTRKHSGGVQRHQDLLESTRSVEGLNEETKSLSFFSPGGREPRLKRLYSSNDILQGLEDKISRQRQHFQKYAGSRARLDREPSMDGDSWTFTVPSFKFWSSAQAIFNDPDFETKISGDVVRIFLQQRPYHDSAIGPVLANASDPDIQEAVSQSLRLPSGMPSSTRASVDAYIEDFVRSRARFERVAKVSLSTALHPGGLLTIRPITALNLPDLYTGMFVKVRYGSVTGLSETVDARVYPTWVTEEQTEALCTNDLAVHVAPQKTSGTIRLSVIGERSQTQLHTKTELGILDLPVGSAVAACIDCSSNDEAAKDTNLESHSDSVAWYIRWFPLTSPKDAIQVEGDGGRSTRPPDSEKTNDNMFRDYFAPCIKLALSWKPEPEQPKVTKPVKPKFADSAPPSPSTTSGNSAHSLTTKREAVQVGNSAHSLTTKREAVQVGPPVVKTYVTADIGRVSVALIDSQRSCELLSLSVLDIDLRYWITNAKTRLGMTVGWLQLDYQDSDVREPVVFAPTPKDFLVPVLQTLAVKDNNRSGSDIISFDFIDLSVAEFDLTVEERLVLDVHEFLSSINYRKRVVQARSGMEREKRVSAPRRQSLMTTADNDTDAPSLLKLLDSHLIVRTRMQEKMYIKKFFLGDVKVNLSYLRGKKSVQEGRGEKRLDMLNSAVGDYYHLEQLSGDKKYSDVFQAWRQHTSDEERHAEEEGKGTNNFAVVFAALFPTVSDAPIRLPGKGLVHVFERPSEIVQSLRKFYVTETLKQIYKIVGSLDFVGNPTMLVSAFVSGVRDLFVTPSMAFWKSPTDPSRVGLGVAQGTLSLVSHSASGFFGFLAKVSARAGQGVAILSLDADFREWHRNHVVVEATNLNRDWKRRGVQKVERMLTRPLIDIIIGITGGISGLVILPVKGYQQSGNIGLAKGLGLAKGVAAGGIGLIAKPTVGILDAFTHFNSSIHDIAKSVNILDKRLQPAIKLRMPYVFGMMSILAPFDPVSARAAHLLKRFPIRESRHDSASTAPETMVHAELLPSIGIETYAIATTSRIIILRVKKEASGTLASSLRWEITFSKESTVSSEVTDHGHNGVALSLLKRQANSTDVGSPDVADPQLGARSAASSSLEERIPFAATDAEYDDEYDHDTERDGEGKPLRNTIVAEYQYRRQLTRLHNVISCIQGNLDAVIRDPSLGRPGSSTEGYTSFGMFYFQRNTDSDNVREDSWLQRLDNLPWISQSEFVAAQEMTPSEQKLYIASLRKGWTYDDVVEEPPVSQNVTAEGSLAFCTHDKLISALDLADRHWLPTIQDAGSIDEDVHADERTKERTSMSRYATARQLELFQDFSASSVFSEPLRDSDHIPGAPDVTQQQPIPQQLVQIDKHAFQSPKYQTQTGPLSHSHDSDLSHQSFHTAVGDNRSDCRMRNSHSATLQEQEHGLPLTRVQSSTAAPARIFHLNKEQATGPSPPPPRQPPDADLRNTPETGVRSSFIQERQQDHDQKPPPRQDSQGVDRMERMERLLERLLIFSSEQALGHSLQHPELRIDEVATLRQEVAELRAQLQQSGRVPPAEVASLRNEIASLRAQLGIPALADLKGDSEPAIQQID